MTDTVLASLIGIGGTVVVAITGTLTQLGITRALIKAERERDRQRVDLDERSRRRDRYEERLLNATAELIAASDPQAPGGGDHGKAALVIQRIQLMLDLQQPTHKSLNTAVNLLGIRLREYEENAGHPMDEEDVQRAVLEAQGRVLDTAKEVIRSFAVAAT